MKTENYINQRAEIIKQLDKLDAEQNQIIQEFKDGDKTFAEACNLYIRQAVSIILKIPMTKIQAPYLRNSVEARMLCFYVLKNNCHLSYREIAKLFNTDHANVHKKAMEINLYIKNQVFPEYLILIDVINQRVDEKLRPLILFNNAKRAIKKNKQSQECQIC